MKVWLSQHFVASWIVMSGIAIVMIAAITLAR